jgi:hypothetical protein
LILKDYNPSAYKNLIGYTYLANNKATYFSDPIIFDYSSIVADIWNNLTDIDAGRYPGGGWYTTAAQEAFMCTLMQLARLDKELSSQSNSFNRLNLVPQSFSDLTCNSDFCDLVFANSI